MGDPAFFVPVSPIVDRIPGQRPGLAGLTDRYREELQTNYNWEADFQEWLGSLKPEEDFTLLCFEPEGEPCHRRVAAAWLLEKMPELGPGQIR